MVDYSELAVQGRGKLFFGGLGTAHSFGGGCGAPKAQDNQIR